MRRFSDFDADSCLVIYDARVFEDRFIEALKGKLLGWYTAGTNH
jgi:hypothetical protein